MLLITVPLRQNTPPGSGSRENDAQIRTRGRAGWHPLVPSVQGYNGLKVLPHDVPPHLSTALTAHAQRRPTEG